MDKLDRIKTLLDNPDLMDKHNYTEKDVEELILTGREKHSNEFIEFILVSVSSMNENRKGTNRAAAGRLIKNVEQMLFT